VAGGATGHVVVRGRRGGRGQRLAAEQVAAEEALRLVDAADAAEHRLAVGPEAGEGDLLETALERQLLVAVGQLARAESERVATRDLVKVIGQRHVVGRGGPGAGGARQREQQRRERPVECGMGAHGEGSCQDRRGHPQLHRRAPRRGPRDGAHAGPRGAHARNRGTAGDSLTAGR